MLKAFLSGILIDMTLSSNQRNCKIKNISGPMGQSMMATAWEITFSKISLDCDEPSFHACTDEGTQQKKFRLLLGRA